MPSFARGGGLLVLAGSVGIGVEEVGEGGAHAQHEDGKAGGGGGDGPGGVGRVGLGQQVVGDLPCHSQRQ